MSGVISLVSCKHHLVHENLVQHPTNNISILPQVTGRESSARQPRNHPWYLLYPQTERGWQGPGPTEGSCRRQGSLHQSSGY